MPPTCGTLSNCLVSVCDIKLSEPREADVVTAGTRRRGHILAYRRRDCEWLAAVEYEDEPGVTEWVNQDSVLFQFLPNTPIDQEVTNALRDGDDAESRRNRTPGSNLHPD